MNKAPMDQSENQNDTLLSFFSGESSDDKVSSEVNDEFGIDPKGLGHCLYEGLKEHAGKVVQVNIDDGKVDTGSELLERSIRTAIHMRNLGIKPGDVISIYSHSQMNCASVFAAATFLGAINASLDPKLSENDVEHLISQVAPKMAFVSTECEDIIQRVVDKLNLEVIIIVFGESKSNSNYSSYIAPQEAEDKFIPWAANELNDTILIMFSSGTTGLAKGICWNHNFALYHTRTKVVPVTLFTNTIYWIGPTLLLILSMRFGTTKAFTKTPDLTLLWNQIETYHIDMLALSPYMASQIIDLYPDGLASSLKYIMVSGGCCSVEYINKVEAKIPTVTVFNPYGQTETGVVFDIAPLIKEPKKKISSVGIPFSNVLYKVVDSATGEILGPNQKGELRIKTKYTSHGYYNIDSSDICDEEGYLKTGDIFYYDEDMHYYMVDRAKEMFKYKGHHVTPVKYEAILQTHPEIELAALVGVPHPTEESHICAVVQLTKGSKLSSEDVREYYDERVEDIFKIRAGVMIVNEIPVTPTGKLKRRDIKEMVLKAQM